MKKWNQYFLLGMTALGFMAAGIGTAVSAPPPPDQTEWGCGYRQDGGPGRGRNWERMQERMSQHQAALHDKLKLNAQQETAWKNYTSSTMKNISPPYWDRAEMMKLNAPARMEKMLEKMKEHENQMAAHLNALKTFYATLSPEQQKIFDAETVPGRAWARRNGK